MTQIQLRSNETQTPPLIQRANEIKRELEAYIHSINIDPEALDDVATRIMDLFAEFILLNRYVLHLSRSEHTGTLIPQYLTSDTDLQLPIDERTTLFLRKGFQANELYGQGERKASFNGRIDVEDPKMERVPVSIENNFTMAKGLLAISKLLRSPKAGEKVVGVENPTKIRLANVEIDPQKNLATIALVLKRLVQVLEKFQTGVTNFCSVPPSTKANVTKIVDDNRGAMEQLARNLGVQ